MRALRVREPGAVSALEMGEIDAPAMRPGAVRIAVRAAGLGFADVLVIAGRYQVRRTPPFVPGSECAGVVVEVASDVTDLAVGDRVVAVPLGDAWADEVVVDAFDVARIADALDFDRAAALPIAYGTALHALRDRAAIRAGETLLVHGAAGAVGLATIDYGRALGARVIASVGSDDKAALALAQGADDVIRHREEDLADAVMRLTDGRGADVVLDTVGGAAFDASLRCLAWGGRLLIVGFASGTIPRVSANRLLLSGGAAVGVYWGGLRDRDAVAFHGELAAAMDDLASGRLRGIRPEVIGIDDVVPTLEALENGAVGGKFVVAWNGENER